MATVLSFVRPERHGWSNGDRAQFVRIQRILSEAGVHVEIEEGVTDEGDPWCVLCSGMTGEVVVHIALLDGAYLLDSPVLPVSIRERSLEDCARRFAGDATLLAARTRHDPTIAMHPSAMLAAVILTIFFWVEALDRQSAPGAVPEEEDAAEEARDAGDAAAPDAGPLPGEARDADGEEDEGSALAELRQGVQDAVDLIGKAETERLCWSMPGLNQSWAMALPAGAFAAAMAHIWAVLEPPAREEAEAEAAPAGEADGARADRAPRAPDSAGPLATDGEGPRAAEAGDGTRAPPAEAQAPGAAVEGFILADFAPPAPQDPAPAPPPGDSFVFVAPDAGEGAREAPAPPPGASAPSSGAAPSGAASSGAAPSVVARLMEFFPEDGDGFWDAFVVSDTFLEADGFAGNGAAPDGAAPDGAVAAAPPAAPLPGPALPEGPPVAAPVADGPVRERLDDRTAADFVTAFVTLTGRVYYELEDGNLLLRDAGIADAETASGIETRILELPDSEIVFVGFSADLDTIFA